VFAGYDLAYQFTGSRRAARIVATDGTDGGHGPLADGGLLSVVIGVTVAAFDQPLGSDPVQQPRQRSAFAAGFCLEFRLPVSRQAPTVD